MKILHTSDWHLGRSLFGRKRYQEFSLFLQWLLKEIERHKIEALIIAGDIFDTSSPSNRAQQLYFQFLKDVSAGCCRHVIIIGGNHDSPSLLEAPKELLRFFQVHVMGSAKDDPAQEVCSLVNPSNQVELIVCAVPYLRDRDIRKTEAGETLDDKSRNLIDGITAHYHQVAEHAESVQQMLDNSPPIIGTGHLFAAGGQKVEGDGTRDLYVGSLVHVDRSIFPSSFSYIALGHLHSTQKVGGCDHIRYSGSPLPMSFNESSKQKFVLAVTINSNDVTVEEIPVPQFQYLETIRGDLDALLESIEQLKEQYKPIWLEIIYVGEDIVGHLQKTLHNAIADSQLEILRIVNKRILARALQQQAPMESLDTMTEQAVFLRCLETHDIPENQHDELIVLFQQTLQDLSEEDTQAE